MTEEEQIIALAEFEGWTHIENKNTMAVGGIWVGYPPRNQLIGKKQRLPNYTSDLNATNKVEALLTGSDHTDFCERLKTMEGHYGAYSASAKQRCKALLKTIDKWKE